MSGREVVATAAAKVNLYLGVGPLRADGFHELATVYQAVGLHDEVRVRASSVWRVQVRGADPAAVALVPADESNLAVRAARALAGRHGVVDPVEITITKGIPVAGGMAGGSADAAATLVACDALWGTGTPREQLLDVAAALGSDVPFSVVGGTAVGTGRGEALEPVPTSGTWWWVAVTAREGLATPAVYRELDRMRSASAVARPRVPGALLAALADGDGPALAAALANDLQQAALRLRPELERTLDRGLQLSASAALLSGSGPTCLFLARSREHAEAMAADLGGAGLGPTFVAPAPVRGAHVVGEDGA